MGFKRNQGLQNKVSSLEQVKMAKWNAISGP